MLISLSSMATGQFPGGVGEPVIWLHAGETAGDEQSMLENKGTLDLSTGNVESNVGLLNYHPLWPSRALHAAIAAHMASESTYFIVYKSDDVAHERNIWSLERKDTTRLIMTSRRFVDLEIGLYANAAASVQTGQLNSYMHQRNREQQGDWKLSLFDAPATTSLPVVAADMQVGEMIIYDRALSEKERIQVESYLALKYGLSLQHPIRIVYLDSDGEVIWSDDHAGEFIHRVAAIGCDQGGCLDNRQSQSASAVDPISIALVKHAEQNAHNPNMIGDRQYLLWADNGGSLELVQNNDGTRSIERTWRMNNLSRGGQQTELLLETRKLAVVEDVDFWWLKVERDGLPDLFRGAAMGKGVIRFDSVVWDSDGSGTDQFTFIAGGEIMPAIEMSEPDCGMANGRIVMQCHGGKGQYTYTIALKGQMIYRANSETEIELTDLASGVYDVFIEDRSGNKWNERIVLTSSEESKYCIPNSVSMPSSGKLRLTRDDFCASTRARVSWIDNDGNFQDGDVTVSEAGTYFIRIEEDDCVDIHRLQVTLAESSLFGDVAVFPNPVKAGDKVNYRVVLKDDKDVGLSLFDASGRILIDREIGSGQVMNGSLMTPIVPGTYTLRFSVDNDISSTQIITID